MVEPTGVKRKLTVILAADAEGYTRLMREAEEPTLETLTEYREIIDGLITRHDGRVFSTAGDSVVAGYQFIDDFAVRCEGFECRFLGLAHQARVAFRVGGEVDGQLPLDARWFHHRRPR